jgi:phosphocarrier protein
LWNKENFDKKRVIISQGIKKSIKSIDFIKLICYNGLSSIFIFTRIGARTMISRNVTIQNNVGLHARPATFFIQKANSYKSSIWVERDDRRVNAKSLLGVLSLGIVKGMTITLIADGPDEEAALGGLSALIDTGFTE